MQGGTLINLKFLLKKFNTQELNNPLKMTVELSRESAKEEIQMVMKHF